MNDVFLTKKGLAIRYLASDLIRMKKGDRLPVISEYQERFKVSRGTIQNAQNFLKEKGAIVCENRGQLGTFLVGIDYDILQTYAIFGPVPGTMPLPYSKRYEGLATGLYAAFEKQDLRLNLAYIRGAKERIRLVCADVYRFAIVSRFAAKEAISEGYPVQIVVDFGKETYLSQHVLLFSDATKRQMEDGMKVGIDYSSHDQHSLIERLTSGLHVTLVEMPAYQLLQALQAGKVEAGVWNYDEIMDKGYQGLNYVFIDTVPELYDMNVAVMLCKKDDAEMTAIIENNAMATEVLKVQKEVLSGKKVPNY